MAKLDIKDHVQSILDEYAPQQPDATSRCGRSTSNGPPIPT